MAKYSEFFVLLRQTGQSKEDIVSSFTSGRTASLSDLSQKEYNALCASLRKSLNGTNVYTPDNEKGDKLRKAIIGCFHTMKYSNAPAAAKAWAEKMGAGSGPAHVKRKFNKYSNQELMMLLQKAQKAVEDYQSAIRKQFLDHA